MAGKLHVKQVQALTTPGRYSDGGNLYLAISGNGGKRWVFQYRANGKKRELGLGSAAAGPSMVGLQEARSAAEKARRLLREGQDPIAVLGSKARRQSAPDKPTFGRLADEYIATHAAGWRNSKHIAQWQMTLGEKYCAKLRPRPVDSIDTHAVLEVLQPVWSKVPETASRLRGRIEAVLDYARALGLHPGPNPAEWRGHLKRLMPSTNKLSRGHHKALPYEDIADFMAILQEHEGIACRALELLILTAMRTAPVLEARWEQIDLDKAVWIAPASSMKGGIEHRVPLSGAAVQLLRGLPHFAGIPFVFPGKKTGSHLSNMTMLMQLRRMGYDVTAHGFRATFRTWATETTSFSELTQKHALAHQISDKVDAAYRRGDQFEKRRQLMEAWAQFCYPAQSKVVFLEGRK